MKELIALKHNNFTLYTLFWAAFFDQIWSSSSQEYKIKSVAYNF